MAPKTFDSEHTPKWGTFEQQWLGFIVLGFIGGIVMWLGFIPLWAWQTRLVRPYVSGSTSPAALHADSTASIVGFAAIMVAVVASGAIIAAAVQLVMLPKWPRDQAKRRAVEVGTIDYPYAAPEIRALVAQIARNPQASINSNSIRQIVPLVRPDFPIVPTV
jgi:hypothetical protein